ncbi:uncharacterized protein LOC125801299 [Astyanax mexicanus]|uniref:uncharacterized protein LOC125801299 n=1 Tax=Astyanax mexicanus TaxID=7994 RepID=UPI0020CACEBE|nr:uncharacterized protein LOC125801299 [Astyanax mexicanus]
MSDSEEDVPVQQGNDFEQLQHQIDELSRWRDETQANGAVGGNSSTRSYIYVPRERHIQSFCGEPSKDGRSVEEFIEEVERVLRAREQSQEEQVDFLISLLKGSALEEVRLCMGSEQCQPSDVFDFLRKAFGERRSAAQLLQTFYQRRQAEGENLRDYSHALSQILTSVVKQSPDTLSDEKTILRDQFIEGLREASLRRELRKFVREKPQSSLLEVRNEAMLWSQEDSRSYGPRVVKHRHMQSEVTGETNCSAIHMGGEHTATLESILKTLTQQAKQLSEQDRTISELAKAVQKLATPEVKQTGHYRETRTEPKFTEDGQPICFRCNGVGHIAKNCTQRRHEKAKGPMQQSSSQGNGSPRLL